MAATADPGMWLLLLLLQQQHPALSIGLGLR
jgi:hypothetical protein